MNHEPVTVIGLGPIGQAMASVLLRAGHPVTVWNRTPSRAGNLVILPYRYESVWWYEKNKFEMRFYGHHGGLTPQEMETVLYSVEV